MDRILSRTKYCRTGTELFSSVFLCSRYVQVFGRLPPLRGTPKCFRQSLHLVSVRVRVGIRALSLTGSAVVPLLYTYIYIYIYTHTFILFSLCKSVAVSMHECVCEAPLLSLHCSSFCSVIPWSKTPVVPPRFTRTRVNTRHIW